MASHHTPYAAERLAPTGDIFLDLLRPAFPDWSLPVYDVVEQRYPDSLDDIDAVVITGSPASVYDNEPWISKLLDATREVAGRNIPIIGICFGHQVLAEALGGKVSRADVGWGLGIKPVDFEQREWMKPYRATLNLSHIHQDQVTQLPEGAERLAGDSFCPNAAFVIGKRAFAVQGHPEFTNDTLEVLTQELMEKAPPEVFSASLSSLRQRNDGPVLAQWIAQFLRLSVPHSP